MADQWVLQVKRDGNQSLAFQLEDSQGEVRASSPFVDEDDQRLQGANQAFGDSLFQLVGVPNQARSKLRMVKEQLQALLPQTVADRLAQGQQLIELQCHSADYPWRFALKDQHLAATRSGTVTVLANSEGDKKAWLGHSASSLEGWSASEASAVEGALGENFQVKVASGREFSRRGLLKVLSEGQYAVVHLIAYLSEEGLVTHDGTVTFTELERLEGQNRPRLVAAHLIAQRPGLSQRLAQGLLSGGVPTVLTTDWPPSPDNAARWSETFYRQLSQKTAWEAFSLAVKAVQDESDPYLSAHSYAAYGDWSLQPSDWKPVQVQTSKSAPTARGAWQSEYRFVVLEGPEAGQEIPLFAAALASGRTIVIGRQGPRPVDLAFEDESLKNQTASLSRPEEKLVLSNLTGSPDEVRVNGLPLYSPVTLEGWEEIRLGSNTCLRFEPTSGNLAPTPMGSASSFALVVSEGVPEDLQSRTELPSRVTLVGRQSDCGLMLHDPSVSRHHLTLVPKQNSFYLSAIGDSQVVVNGFLVKGEHELKNGDTIQLSPTTILTLERVSS